MTRVCTTEEGRKHLKEMHLIEPKDILDGEMLAGVLAQVSLFPGMSQAVRDTIWSVALLLVSSTLGEAGAPALSACMEQRVSEFMEAIKSVTKSAITEVKTTSSTLTETSMQFKATTTSYWDVLTSKGPSLNLVMVATTMDMRVRVREGVKAHQILIDIQNHEEGILWGTSDVGLVESANAALQHLEDPPGHCFTSACHLGNGGVIMHHISEHSTFQVHTTYCIRFSTSTSA